MRTKIIGGTQRQRQVLREILAGLGEPKIGRVEIRLAGNDFMPHPPGAVGVTFRHGQDFRTRWESWIAGQAFVDRSVREDLPSVALVGVRGDASSRAAPSRSGPGTPPTAREREAVVEQLAEAARRAGAELKTVRFVRPFGSAIAVTFRVQRPARFLSERWYQLSGAVAQDLRPRFRAGHRIDIRDDKDVAVLGSAALGEFGGSSWIAKQYEGCAQISLSVPLGYKPPPCPLESG